MAVVRWGEGVEVLPTAKSAKRFRGRRASRGAIPRSDPSSRRPPRPLRALRGRQLRGDHHSGHHSHLLRRRELDAHDLLSHRRFPQSRRPIQSRSPCTFSRAVVIDVQQPHLPVHLPLAPAHRRQARTTKTRQRPPRQVPVLVFSLAVQTAASTPPLRCHCVRCRKFHASAFATLLSLLAHPTASSTIAVSRKYESPCDGLGKPLSRLFCGNCRSVLGATSGDDFYLALGCVEDESIPPPLALSYQTRYESLSADQSAVWWTAKPSNQAAGRRRRRASCADRARVASAPSRRRADPSSRRSTATAICAGGSRGPSARRGCL